MKLPAIRGLIRRRILVSFQVDPEVIQRQLPRGFQPQCVGDSAIAGLCLIRLEQMRPEFCSLPLGFQSENAAHRIAVCWSDADGDEKSGVYIPLRHTNSVLNRLAGGRLFPSEQQLAQFDVRDEQGGIEFHMRSSDGEVTIDLHARASPTLPKRSVFHSLAAASAFYQGGSLGYSARSDSDRLDGVSLSTDFWQVEPLAVTAIASSYFDDTAGFPPGSIEFDSALIMRNIPHQWESEADSKVLHPQKLAAAKAGSPAY
jgi:hypothetical protein